MIRVNSENLKGNAMPDGFVPSSQSSEIIAAMRRKNEEARRARLEAISAAKATSPDKEPFNVEQFASLYNLRGDDGALAVSPDTVETLEVGYYLDNPNIQTLQEFADHLTWLDQNATN